MVAGIEAKKGKKHLRRVSAIILKGGEASSLLKKVETYKTKNEKMIHLSGPVSAQYLSNGSKKIVLLGDHHGNFEGACGEGDNSVRVDKHLQDAFASGSMEFNLILEDSADWLKAEYNLRNNLPYTDKEDEFIAAIYNVGFKHYGKSEKKAVHINTLRLPLGIEKLEFGRNWELILEHLAPQSPSTDLKELFWGLYQSPIELFYRFHNDYIENKGADQIDFGSPKLNKAMQELEQKIGKEHLRKLMDVVHEELDSFMTNLFRNPVYAYDIFPLSMQVLNVLTHLAELYTVYIVMTSPLNNNIVYVGSAHARILRKYFDVLGFSIDHKDMVHDDKEDFRCVLAIPFEVYFNTT